MMQSYASYFQNLPIQERTNRLNHLSKGERDRLRFLWRFWRRPNQTPPPDPWRVWMILAGRGFGKTRTGAEMVREWVKNYSLVNLIGATVDDARDIMIEGESGILAICPPEERPVYVKNASKLEWPNGAKSLVFSADKPDRLRGKQHMKIWADELGSWRYPESWDQALFGLRLGDNPQAIVTTTPKPTSIVKSLMKSPHTKTTRGSTYDNRPNLAPAFYDSIITRYEGTRLGRQELNAEILDDNPDALWKRSDIDDNRVFELTNEFQRIVVAVDPSATATGDEAGIITVGLIGRDIFVLSDDSIQGTPLTWASAAIAAYHKHHANSVIAEGNNGGEMVSFTIHNVTGGINVPVELVHASRGKQTRAEPIAALYEQGRGHHVGIFPDLEDELCNWMPGMDSPNRLDALVWGATHLTEKLKSRKAGSKRYA